MGQDFQLYMVGSVRSLPLRGFLVRGSPVFSRKPDLIAHSAMNSPTLMSRDISSPNLSEVHARLALCAVDFFDDEE